MKQGFFDLGTGDTPETIKTQSPGRIQGCNACGLSRDCLTPKMEPSGKGKLKILIVGEAPGEKEDEKGIQFIGRSGSLLEETLEDLGVDMRRDCRITNAVNCRPVNNKTPGDAQVNECRPRLLREIARFKPDVIIPLGATGVQAVIGHKLSGRFTGLKNTAFYGEQIPDQSYGCWICPTYHPAHFLYDDNKNDKVKMRIWRKDLEKAVKIAKNDTEFPIIEPKKHVLITDNIETATLWLDWVLENNSGTVVYDYETTGIKPHREGHDIVCASICNGKSSYAFPFFQNTEFKKQWKEIMINPNIKKIAHKLDFENIWTYNRATRAGGYWPTPYEWDTCLAAHCIDNKKPVNLKFLTYVNFGVIGYDDDIDSFIRGVKPGEDKKSGNHFNLIHEAPMKKLLEYCALDSYFSFKLYEKQKQLLKENQLEGFRFFLEGAETLSRIQNQGMKIDVEWMKKQMRRLSKQMELAEEKVIRCNEIEKWNEANPLKEFNFNSNVQLSELLYVILKYKKPAEGGKTDEEALDKIGTGFTDNILKYRKLKKIRDTYLAQYAREEVDGIIRPFFNLSSKGGISTGDDPCPRTFRSSSNSPNIQNVPNRNKQSKQMIRSIMKPTPGNRLIEYDFKGMEVCVSACYHQDPT
ncbi:MAG: DNA polymerase, partial [Candidatus Hodarchaeales archaeon]